MLKLVASALDATADAALRHGGGGDFHPAAAIIRPRRGGRPPIFPPFRLEILLKTQVRRRVVTRDMTKNPVEASLHVVARLTLVGQHAVEFLGTQCEQFPSQRGS